MRLLTKVSLNFTLRDLNVAFQAAENLLAAFTRPLAPRNRYTLAVLPATRGPKPPALPVKAARLRGLVVQRQRTALIRPIKGQELVLSSFSRVNLEVGGS